MNNSTTLFINRICPFAERTLITIQEKKIPHTLKEISLTNMQPSYTETYHKAFAHDPSSEGKVPVLIDGNHTLAESDLISWYLAEKYQTGTHLIPTDAFKRLKVRWFAQTYSKIIDSFYGFVGFGKKSEQQKAKCIKDANQTLEQINASIVLPYAIGDEFTLADVLVYPWFARWVVIQHYAGFKIDPKFNKIHSWIKNIRERDSVKSIIQPNQYFIQGYGSYFD